MLSMKKFINLTCNSLLVDNLEFKKKFRFSCGVSGGQDSMVSFFLFFHFLALSTNFYQLDIVYCNHFSQLKNFVSTEFIFQCSFFTQVSYGLLLPQGILINENRSREWRKSQFSRFLDIQNTSYLITGRTKTDTFETKLTHLFRGTSPNSFLEINFLNFKKSTTVFFSVLLIKPTPDVNNARIVNWIFSKNLKIPLAFGEKLVDVEQQVFRNKSNLNQCLKHSFSFSESAPPKKTQKLSFSKKTVFFFTYVNLLQLQRRLRLNPRHQMHWTKNNFFIPFSVKQREKMVFLFQKPLSFPFSKNKFFETKSLFFGEPGFVFLNGFLNMPLFFFEKNKNYNRIFFLSKNLFWSQKETFFLIYEIKIEKKVLGKNRIFLNIKPKKSYKNKISNNLLEKKIKKKRVLYFSSYTKSKTCSFIGFSTSKVHFLHSNGTLKDEKNLLRSRQGLQKSKMYPFLFALHFLPLSLQKKGLFWHNKLCPKILFFSKGINSLFLAGRGIYCIQPVFSHSFCFAPKTLNNKRILLKPLENLSRFDVFNFIRISDSPLLMDITNFSTTFFRNKIRHKFFPFIKLFVNKKVDSLLIQFFSLVQEQQKYIQNDFLEFKILFKNWRVLRKRKKGYAIFFHSRPKEHIVPFKKTKCGFFDIFFGKELQEKDIKPCWLSSLSTRKRVTKNFSFLGLPKQSFLRLCVLSQKSVPSWFFVDFRLKPNANKKKLFLQKNMSQYHEIEMHFRQTLKVKHLYDKKH